MVGSLTWEESKTILSIWAVCSAPLIISNDVRPGRVQQRVLDLFLNPVSQRLEQRVVSKHARYDQRPPWGPHALLAIV